MSTDGLERGPDDPVSWLVVERGWKVVDRDGGEIGRVDEVVGDTQLDIFDGLVISTGLLSAPRYVPAERVGPITPGRLQLELSKDEAAALPEYEGKPLSTS